MAANRRFLVFLAGMPRGLLAGIVLFGVWQKMLHEARDSGGLWWLGLALFLPLGAFIGGLLALARRPPAPPK